MVILGGDGEPHHIAGLALNDLSDSRRPGIQCRAFFWRSLIVVVMPAGDIAACVGENCRSRLWRRAHLRQPRGGGAPEIVRRWWPGLPRLESRALDLGRHAPHRCRQCVTFDRPPTLNW